MTDPVQFRLDPETRRLLEQFASTNGLRTNEAARFLLEAALKRDPDQAAASTAIWRVQQLLQRGMSRVREQVATALRAELVQPFEGEAPAPQREAAPTAPVETRPLGPVDESLHGTATTKRKRRGARGGR